MMQRTLDQSMELLRHWARRKMGICHQRTQKPSCPLRQRPRAGNHRKHAVSRHQRRLQTSVHLQSGLPASTEIITDSQIQCIAAKKPSLSNNHQLPGKYAVSCLVTVTETLYEQIHSSSHVTRNILIQSMSSSLCSHFLLIHGECIPSAQITCYCGGC